MKEGGLGRLLWGRAAAEAAGSRQASSRRWLLKRQGHGRQVAAGFHQNQWAFVHSHDRWTLARHADGLWLGRNGCLHSSDLVRVGIHPLQARRGCHLLQRIDGQRERLNPWHAGGGRSCHYRRSCGCTSDRGCSDRSRSRSHHGGRRCGCRNNGGCWSHRSCWGDRAGNGGCRCEGCRHWRRYRGGCCHCGRSVCRRGGCAEVAAAWCLVLRCGWFCLRTSGGIEIHHRGRC